MSRNLAKNANSFRETQDAIANRRPMSATYSTTHAFASKQAWIQERMSELKLRQAGLSGPMLARTLRAEKIADQKRRKAASNRRRAEKRAARKRFEDEELRQQQAADSEIDDKLQQM